jgi:hypothetical protein
MIEIRDEELWGKIISEEMASINGNRTLTTIETIRFVNALAKAAVRVEQSGAFMDFDQANDKLLIWSDSNEIYEVNGDKTCQCASRFETGMCAGTGRRKGWLAGICLPRALKK